MNRNPLLFEPFRAHAHALLAMGMSPAEVMAALVATGQRLADETRENKTWDAVLDHALAFREVKGKNRDA